MKKTTKKLVTLVGAMLLASGMSMTALADGTWSYSLRSTSEIASGTNDPTESVTITGADTVTVWDMNANDKLVLIGGTNMPENLKFYVDACARRDSTGNYHYYVTDRIFAGDAKIGLETDLYKAVEGFWEQPKGKDLTAMFNLDSNTQDTLWGLKLSNGEVGSDKLVWFRFVGTREAGPAETSQAVEKGYGEWRYDDFGWWIQYADGTYLVNDWWKSPYSGLWYFMGADGYMVTNSFIDGHWVNSDGARVE